ncbi:hypothetical protein GCM10020220_097910 [Nonomuraea rubra]|uniref:hypothetical protein n=1 Tax=Nonomuraea rubra TaxID=46180 RepID=UPI0031E71C5E
MLITPRPKTRWTASSKGSAVSLKWLNVPRAAWTATIPTSTNAATAKTVASRRSTACPGAAGDNIQARVVP